MRLPVITVLVVAMTPVVAQQSASYDLTEHVLNAGGRPAQGTIAGSPSFVLTLDEIGEAVVAANLTSTSYRLDAGFSCAYQPPGEVYDLEFTSSVDLAWKPDGAAGHYNLYRGPIDILPGAFGSCLTEGIEECGAVDEALPPVGQCWFYLVTVENRLLEEGPLGWQSDGAGRPNPTPCP